MAGLYPVPDPDEVCTDELASYRRAVAHAAERLARDEPEDDGPDPQYPDAA
jgi:hypothetical protein